MMMYSFNFVSKGSVPMSCLTIENASLAPYCSMKVGGNAKYIALPKTESELTEKIGELRSASEKFIVVGNCSNLIFPDGLYDGTVIITSNIRGLSFKDGIITAKCGETLSSLARFACDNSITGFEFCYGIPGTVGGGVYMNAGAYGGEISQKFIRGKFLTADMRLITLSREECDFGYRKSIMMREPLILLSAQFDTLPGDKNEIKTKMDELMSKRKTSQPLEYPSCGSAFKRPEGYYAGALIEQCGLKGYNIGGARVSEKHAGFIINGGNATATDVIQLLKRVSDVVFEQKGVRLEPEIKIIE